MPLCRAIAQAVREQDAKKYFCQRNHEIKIPVVATVAMKVIMQFKPILRA